MIGRIEQWLDHERDQLALWLPVALGSGIAGWFVIATREGWIAFILALLAGALAAMAMIRPGRLRRALVLFQFLAAMGCLLVWWRAESVAAPRLERPQVVRFTARVEKVELLAARNSVRLTLATDPGQALPPLIRVNVDQAKAPVGLELGIRVRLRARLVAPASAALPGAYDFARVAWFRGLGATGRALDPVEIVDRSTTSGSNHWIGTLRARLTDHIHRAVDAHRAVDGSAGGIAAALVTGDQGAISDEDAAAMRTSGLAHLLSISGLHVSAVVGGTMLLILRVLALSPKLALRMPLPVIAAGVAAVTGVGYTLIAGAEVPTVRSCIAAVLILIALAIGREAMTLRLVAAGALIVLLFWPEALVSPSFQLSFAAVTALVAFHEHPRMKALGRRSEGDGLIVRGVRATTMLMATGLVVEAALAPIALYHFHRSGIYGALANMIAIPLTTFVIIPFEAFALVLDSIGLGHPFWLMARISIKLLINIAQFVSHRPGSVASLPTMAGGAFALMVVAGLWFCLWRRRIRWLALPAFALGAVWAAVAPAPDVLITGDGRHVAVRGRDGGLFLLRPRAGDYVREMIGAVSAEASLGDLDRMPLARCNADLCVAEIDAGGRRWRLLATRSPYLVPWRAMVRACAQADVIVSDRRVPRGCVPRWLKADRDLLTRTGGLAIVFDPLVIRRFRRARDDHPWLRISRASYQK